MHNLKSNFDKIFHLAKSMFDEQLYVLMNFKPYRRILSKVGTNFGEYYNRRILFIDIRFKFINLTKGPNFGEYYTNKLFFRTSVNNILPG